MARTTGIEIPVNKHLVEQNKELKRKLKEAYKFISYLEEHVYCKCPNTYELDCEFGYRLYKHEDSCGFKIAEKALEENK